MGRVELFVSVFAADAYLAVAVDWSVHERIIAAYAHPDRRRGKTMPATSIDSLSRGVPAGLAQLGRTLRGRRLLAVWGVGVSFSSAPHPQRRLDCVL